MTLNFFRDQYDNFLRERVAMYRGSNPLKCIRETWCNKGIFLLHDYHLNRLWLIHVIYFYYHHNHCHIFSNDFTPYILTSLNIITKHNQFSKLLFWNLLFSQRNSGIGSMVSPCRSVCPFSDTWTSIWKYSEQGHPQPNSDLVKPR